MTTDTSVRLSFTGPDSHVLQRRPGVGSLTVGPAGGREKPDLVVGPDDPVDWAVLDDQTLADGSPWPRYVRYEGADTSVLDWSRSRPVEGITFTAVRDTVLDADGAQVQQLHVRTEGHHVILRMASATTCRDLVISGDLTRVELHGHPDGTVPGVGIVLPAVAGEEPRGLPPLPALASATTLELRVDPLGAPFDCRTLLQLSGLRSLSLQGALVHLDALADLPLTSLALRFCPDLTGLPPLTTWPDLTSFIAWNIDDQAGKRLRKEIKRLGDDHFSDYVGVSQLRARRWFVEEYGLPFAAWPKATAKDATRLFKGAAAWIAKATSEETVRTAVETFVFGVGELPGMETSEREDAAEAVRLLVSTSPVPVDDETAQSWFDAARSF
ncbi:hypothetical protein [Sanguibacter sp. 25GB23B1]|uniref:hypothetical protein n=1 Tax=unclassified Sanguibacter TaxID=2645534 RepID=UPI0032AF87AA